MPLSAGTRLGPYEIVFPIGAGGMGEVYRARDTRLGRDVAIKVLPNQFSSSPEALARFEREARAVASLNHPNILGIFDFGIDETLGAYAAMELLNGESLSARLVSGALSQRKAVEIAIQIANGLAAAHEKGVVHRDLKPENVFLTSDGRVKILDFGLAKMSFIEPAVTNAPTTPPLTSPGAVLGTVGYMSPEQVRGREVDTRSDIFSFGAVLYEMLTGLRAFNGDSAVETMSAILKEEPPDLVQSGRSISPALDRIVRHCLEKSPGSNSGAPATSRSTWKRSPAPWPNFRRQPGRPRAGLSARDNWPWPPSPSSCLSSPIWREGAGRLRPSRRTSA